MALLKSQQDDFRIIHYSMQSNHIHLIAEALNNKVLEKGMRSLTNSFVKRLRRTKKLKGSIQLERYHLHILRNPTEVENAINYVLRNHQHHTGNHQEDNFSSQVQSFFLDKGKSWLLRGAQA